MYKRIILFTLFSLITASFAFGQHNKRDRGELSEKLKAKKIAYIIDNLEITPEQSEKFWPIYNEYKNEKKALDKDTRASSDMTEAEAKEYLNQRLERARKEIDLREKYNARFLEVISANQLVKLSHVERKFKREMLNDIKRRYSSRRDSN